MLKFIITIAFLFSTQSIFAQIKWMTWEQAIEANKKQPRKIMVDIYTDWCGWCKKMDATTFSHPVIVDYVNKKFYAVKLDGEMTKDVIYGKDTLKFVPGGRKGIHELANKLMDGKASYPTVVYLDEEVRILTPLPGYLKPEQMEPILKYFGENAFVNTKWEDYQKDFKGTITPAE